MCFFFLSLFLFLLICKLFLYYEDMHKHSLGIWIASISSQFMAFHLIFLWGFDGQKF